MLRWWRVLFCLLSIWRAFMSHILQFWKFLLYYFFVNFFPSIFSYFPYVRPPCLIHSLFNKYILFIYYLLVPLTILGFLKEKYSFKIFKIKVYLVGFINFQLPLDKILHLYIPVKPPRRLRYRTFLTPYKVYFWCSPVNTLQPKVTTTYTYITVSSFAYS